MYGTRSFRDKALIATAIGCTALVCASVLTTSLARGRLAFYPRMDDVMYLARGAQLLRAAAVGWHSAGLIEAVHQVLLDWVHDPPHSPWISGAAAIALAFAWAEWIAYLPTAVPVLAFLVYAARLARRAGGPGHWRAFTLVVFAATAPFLAASSYILKPDYAAGIASALAMMTALRGPLLGASLKRLLMIGMLFGFALLSKPAMMLPTSLLAGGTLGICTLRDLWLRRYSRNLRTRPLTSAFRAWSVTLATTILIAAPHFVFALRTEWEYTRGTLTGNGVEMWGFRGTWREHTLYYLTGPGGRLMLDGVRSLVPLSAALVLYLWSVLVRRSHRRRAYAAAMGAAMLMAWAGPTVSVVKIPQFASCFSALAWLLGVYAAQAFARAGRLSRDHPRRRVVPAVASLLIAGILVGRIAALRWTFPLWPADRAHPARATRDARDRFVIEAYQSIIAQCRARPITQSLLVAGGQYDLATPLITLWTIRDGVSLHVQHLQRKPEDDATTSAGSTLPSPFNGYDMVLVGANVARRDIPTIVQVEADEYYLRLARADPQLVLVSRHAESGSSAVFELYTRRSISP